MGKNRETGKEDKMPEDLAIIKELEEAIGSQLPRVEYDRIQNYRNNGYTLNGQEQVVGLNLDTIENKYIPEILLKLKQLRRLSLGSTKLKDYSFLSGLSGLTKLSLYHNQIAHISFLSGLSGLTHLSLYDNQIADISFLSGLSGLTHLYLDNNQIADISFLSGLSGLTHLYLGNNKIDDFSALSGLSGLTKLSLYDNQIADISFLSGLNGLTQLSLRNNPIADISFLSGLSGLTNLDLSSNQIADFSFLSGLSGLTHLYLGNNKIDDISPLSGLSGLTNLDLSSNQIADFSFLSGLKQLTFLNLINNKIIELPESMVNLGVEIDVGKEDAYSYDDNGIFLFGNPIEKPPLEITRKGSGAIKAYFESLKEKEAENLPVNEVKVLLVGDGAAGKTSLSKCLRGLAFDDQEAKTGGINIEPWQIEKSSRKIKVNLWDFGGQEIMHATHQFFLSQRSLYILVLDGRKEEKTTEYWLKHIEIFGGESPVLVVMNKIDTNPGFDLNRKFLQDKYTNIKGFFRISCAQKTGITDFCNALKQELSRLEMLSTTWPAAWFRVKTELENMQKNFISYEEYVDICSRAGIRQNDEAGRDTLVDFLNDLGVALHFKDLALEGTHVLEPEWATGAVYKIINSQQLADAKGVLELAQLPHILKKQKKKDFEYPKNKYKFIIGLMKKFEICYEIDKQRVLVPDLLQVEETEFAFTYENSLQFVMEYDFLPKSIMPRFIVKMHRDSKPGLQWRTGVVLEDQDLHSSAVVKVDEADKKVSIYVVGSQKREYFAIIRRTLRDIANSFKKLVVNELVPLPQQEKEGISKEYVDYKELIGYEKHGKEEIFSGKLEKSYNVSQLLGAIETPDSRKQLTQGHDYEKMPHPRGGDVYINLEQNQQNLQVQKTETNVDIDIEINIDIKNELPALQGDFETLKDLIGANNPALEKKLEEIGDSLDGVGPGSDKEKFNKPLNKLSRLLKDLGDENSDLHKTVARAKKAIKAAQKVARTYNKFAQWLAMPQVPVIFAGQD
jgi:small GTP-binding protein